MNFIYEGICVVNYSHLANPKGLKLEVRACVGLLQAPTPILIVAVYTYSSPVVRTHEVLLP